MTPISYGIKDFVKVSGISRSLTYELIKRGELKAVKVAGRTLIPATEARRLVGEAA